MIINPYLRIAAYAEIYELVSTEPNQPDKDIAIGTYEYADRSAPHKFARMVNSVITEKKHGPVLTNEQCENLILDARMEFTRNQIVQQISAFNLEDMQVIATQLNGIIAKRQAEAEERVTARISKLLNEDFPHVNAEIVLSKVQKKLGLIDW